MILSAADGKIASRTTENLDIPALDQGITLRLKRLPAAPAAQPSPKRAVLLVHGAFFPSSTVYDIDLPGGTWLAHLAARGFDAYALDIRGYGSSTRPAFMDGPPGPYVPFATTADAIRDVEAAVAVIRARSGVTQVDLLGWSWGAAIVGGFATSHPDLVGHLVLYAPAWLPRTPPKDPPQAPKNYRTFDHDGARTRVLNGVPPDRIEEINPTAWFERFWAANLIVDAVGAQRTPPVVRAPSGVSQDAIEFWSKGVPTWRPQEVLAPTLTIVGEWDRNTPTAMAEDVHALLIKAKDRRLKIVPEGTHFLALEKNRLQLFDEVSAFLSGTTPR
ncbi:alpha/beta hydrolase [Planctomycetota bacterium]|nr:alpha/beta hydrolase [Planctomycetota bacterium]